MNKNDKIYYLYHNFNFKLLNILDLITFNMQDRLYEKKKQTVAKFIKNIQKWIQVLLF